MKESTDLEELLNKQKDNEKENLINADFENVSFSENFKIENGYKTKAYYENQYYMIETFFYFSNYEKELKVSSGNYKWRKSGSKIESEDYKRHWESIVLDEKGRIKNI